MEFHPSKCNSIHFTRSWNPIKSDYYVYGTLLQTLTSVRYLGIDISSDLRWNKHITATKNKASGTLKFLQRNLRITSNQIKTTAYMSFVRPRLEYGSTVWDPHTQNNIDKLEMVQRRASRWVLGRFHQRSSVGEMLELLKWPSLQQRRTDSRLAMLFKMHNNIVAIDTSAMLIPMSGLANSLNPHKFVVPQTNTLLHRNSFYPRTIREWNALPAGTALAPSLETFKRRLGQLPSLA